MTSCTTYLDGAYAWFPRDWMSTMRQSARCRHETPQSPFSVLRGGRSYRTLARLVAAFLALSSSSICAQTSSPLVGRLLPRLPEASSPLRLKAVSDPVSGRSAFSFQGIEVPPVIRTAPGTQIQINFVNEMSSSSRETCVDGTCRNMTNLHFHGLHVSPDAPQDDVISMMAMPGQSLHYAVDVPLDQPPGLYWYHTHPHGESYQQSLDGMSGAIVVEGIARYVPQVAGMTEQILVLRDFALDEDASSADTLSKVVSLSPTRCGEATGQPSRIFTVNGVIRPKILISPGESQFWRIVNASPDLYADLEINSASMKLVAMDGMPLAFHDPERHQEVVQHILLAPAGRVEAIVEGPKHVGNASLRSRCVDTGPAGDPNPAMVIADLDETGSHLHTSTPTRRGPVQIGRPSPISKSLLARVEHQEPQFVVKFTEDKNGFYINDKKYAPDGPPMTTVKIGQYVHWRVINDTNEIHPFHIHQVHFLPHAVAGESAGGPVWMDTINVSSHGQVDLVMDFTDPIIKGMSVFHCHLLKHEDKGMMAKILFQ